MFFLTPILYPEKFIPLEYKWITIFNPIYKVILPLRSCIYEFNAPINFINSGLAIIVVSFTLLISITIWKKFKNELIQKL